MNREQFCDMYGPWALITGASSGIGLALARSAATRGLNVVLVARNAHRLDGLAQQLRSDCNVEVRTLVADLAEPRGNSTLFQETKELDIGLVVAAAGFGTSGEFAQSEIYSERQMLQVNCLAVMEQVHHYTAKMVRRDKGGFVLLSSLVGFQGTPYSANYAATKAYIQSFAEGLHVELKSKGIDVLSVAPGPVHSGFAARAGMKMGLAAAPADIAKHVLDALPRRSTIRPGVISKLLGWSLATTPRWIAVRIMAQIMRGMAKR